MSGLPKAIIKKYGVTKRAWVVYRGRKRSAPHTPRRKTHKYTGGTMVRHRFARKTYRTARKLIPTSAMVGAFAYALLEPTVDSLSGKVGFGLPANILKGVGGYYLAKKSGIVGGIGMAALTIEVYKLGRGGNLLGGLLGGQAPTGAGIPIYG